MDSIISFAKDASPIVLSLAATLGLIHVVILLLEGRGIIKKTKKTSEVNTQYNVAELNQLHMMNAKLEKIATNHLHGLPEMERTIGRIETKLDEFGKDLVNVRERLARLE